MAKHKFITMLQRRLRYTWKFCYRAVAKRLRKLLRPVFAAFNRRSNARAGFVLPTAALLLLVVSLVVGAILIRTFNRTEQVIGQRQEKVIYNAATPAIDRAKAKIEYLFKNDPRLPGGVPSQERLLAMMVNAGTAETPKLEAPDIGNPYILPDEAPIPLAENSLAWRYPYDSNGDGENDTTIAYSIIFQIPNTLEQLQNQSEGAIEARANALQVRHGPLSAQAKPGCENVGIASRIEAGWLKDPVSSAILRKNFQINAVAVPFDPNNPENPNNGTVATLELQQDRQADRGNKWGAWFRYDLEIAPGQPFYWNGAMHTEGSMFVGNNKLEAFLVSGSGSCIYRAGADTSEVTLATEDNFSGQAMAAALTNDSSRDRMQAVFHEWVDENNANYDDAGRLTLNNTNHSVRGALTPSDIALDPVKVFTEDVSAYRGNFDVDLEEPLWKFPGDSDGENGRIYRGDVPRPYLDDFYRADDRYGPRPAYSAEPEFNLIKNDEGEGLGKKNGEQITGQPKLTTLNAIGSGTDVDPTELGFDGFWERRAWREGMRVMVGQRLELGNDPLPVPTDYANEQLDIPGTNGFNANRQHETLQRRALRDNLAAVQATAIYHQATGDGAPGYPPVAAVATTVHPGTAETLQRSASFEQPDPFKVKPAYNTLFDSDFGDVPDEMLVDFFTGRGTNGWEFEVPNGFFGSVDVDRALENLANFAGDYESENRQGAFPPTQENGRIHPYPELTKWGNFSNLRRAVEDGNGSIADESYKHTAALTLGMLAYNISYLDAFDYPQNQTAINTLDTRLEELQDDDFTNGEVQVVLDGGQRFVEVYEDGSAATGPPTARWELEDGEMPPPEAYIAALPEADRTLARLLHLKEQVQRDRTWGFTPSPLDLGAVGTTPRPRYQYAVRFFHEDADGDGTLDDGEDFNGNGVLDLIFDDANNDGNWDRTTETFITGSEDTQGDPDSLLNPGEDSNGNGILDTPFLINLSCDFSEDSGNNFFGFGEPGSEPEERQFVRLATSLCGQNFNEDDNGNLALNPGEDTNGNTTLDYTQPKYPSLYYLFPLEAHNFEDNQPPDNSYIGDAYIQGLNSGATYSTVSLTNASGIVLKPRPIAQWVLPHEDNINPSILCGNDASPTNINPNCGRYNLVYNGVDEEYHRVAFKDTGFFNGREMMNVRALSMDLNMLKDEGPAGDRWLAIGDDNAVEAGGMVYAFREDAVREDAIARPSGGGACTTFNDITSAGCKSRATEDAQDPAVNPENGISPKPVDFYPDPDRRPYGFRLINGADLSRGSAGLTSYGLTFISDNPTYVQGNFNCHAANAGGDNSCPGAIEEFNQTIRDRADLDPPAYRKAFYDRDDQSQLNNNFATPGNDIWRFSELLVDGLTILSDNFCEGSIEDGFVMAGESFEGTNLRTLLGNNRLGRSTNNNPTLQQLYGCANANETYTSYLNQNRPRTDQDSTIPVAEFKKKWRRENPADSSSPIRVSKNGNPLLSTGQDYSGDYFPFSESYPGTRNSDMKPMNSAAPQQLNGLFLSGIVPSQGLQTYGGLHNFPRFIENWVGVDASISGSFYQLNFSTQATGSFDQDAWEPDDVPQTGNLIYYYGAPNRFWGYDTALQLTPPGPISQRLVSINDRRSEFYRELPLDDPYIKQLYDEVKPGG